jgi:hypothetical protein
VIVAGITSRSSFPRVSSVDTQSIETTHSAPGSTLPTERVKTLGRSSSRSIAPSPAARASSYFANAASRA